MIKMFAAAGGINLSLCLAAGAKPAHGQTQQYQFTFTSNSGSVLLNSAPNTSTLSETISLPLPGTPLAGTFRFTSPTPGSGSANFLVGGAPLADPSFSYSGKTYTTLPNQNDTYTWSSGDIAALKYDLNAAGSNLLLKSNNTFEVGSLFSTQTTGTSAIARTGSDTYAVTGQSAPASGTYAFAADGAPAVSLSFTAQGSTFTDLPNTDDSYLVSSAQVTAMKYDLTTDGKSLVLALSGTYQVLQNASILESGSYWMTSIGANQYTLAGSNATFDATFANLPNQNDRYIVAANALATLKYDLNGSDGYSLRLSDDGTYVLLQSGFIPLDSGSSTIMAVPETSSCALPLAGLACGGWHLRRRKRAWVSEGPSAAPPDTLIPLPPPR